MADLGRKYTDSQIAYIERQLKKEYSDALKDLQAESRKTLERFQKWDAKQQARLKANEITLQDYTNWRKNYMLRSEQVDSLINEMSARMVHADEVATDIINGRVPKVYAENVNYSTYDIEKQGNVNTNFSLVSEDAVSELMTGRTPLFPLARVDSDVDWKWNEKHIRSALTQGILQGESIPKIAKRLQRVTDMDRRAATRNARTLMGRAQNAGRMAGIKRAKALGLPVKKVWIATLDNVTRDSHVDLDGEVQEYDHEFSNGLDYPCASGPPEEVYNCFIPETAVCVDSEIIRGYKHWYDGDVVSIETSSGIQFTCTPNHPILTPVGWVKANALNDGEDLLVANIGDEHFSRRNPYVNHVFARFDTLFKLLEKLSSQRACDLSVNFHSDIATSNVEVVTKEWLLWDDGNSIIAKIINKLLFKCSDFSSMSKSAFMKHLGSIGLTTLGFICRLSKSLSFFLRGLGHSKIHSLRPISRNNTLFPKSLANSTSVNTEVFSKFLNGKASIIKIDKIVNVEIKSFHGYVYNLQTDDNYYFVNNILSHNGLFAIAHNCRCDMRPIYDNEEYDPSDLRNRNTDKLEQADYDEWKNKHKEVEYGRKNHRPQR